MWKYMSLQLFTNWLCYWLVFVYVFFYNFKNLKILKFWPVYVQSNEKLFLLSTSHPLQIWCQSTELPLLFSNKIKLNDSKYCVLISRQKTCKYLALAYALTVLIIFLFQEKGWKKNLPPSIYFKCLVSVLRNAQWLRDNTWFTVTSKYCQHCKYYSQVKPGCTYCTRARVGLVTAALSQWDLL